MSDAPVVLVTGASDGIGLATAVALATRGWHVLVHGRDPRRAHAAADAVRRAGGAGARVAEPLLADFASLDAVRALAAQVAAATPRLDVLLHNAGLFAREPRVSADGHELTFAVNHLAPFLLTAELLPLVDAAAPARIVLVASNAHRGSAIDPHAAAAPPEREYDAYEAYSRSKLANILHARALARRLDAARVTANALHPGVVATRLLREGWGGGGGISTERGARTSVFVATAPSLAGVTGRYFDAEREAQPSRQAIDDVTGEALWATSARLVSPHASAVARAWMDAPA